MTTSIVEALGMPAPPEVNVETHVTRIARDGGKSQLVIAWREYQGREFADLRVFHPSFVGEPHATRRGVTLRADELEAVHAAIGRIIAARGGTR